MKKSKEIKSFKYNKFSEDTFVEEIDTPKQNCQEPLSLYPNINTEISELPLGYSKQPITQRSATVTVSQQPALITQQPTVITQQPAMITQQPTVITQQPTVITQQPMVMHSSSFHNLPANNREWSSAKCDCFEDMYSCLCVLCLPLLFKCSLAQRMGEGCCVGCTGCGLIAMRSVLRTRHGIRGSIQQDSCDLTCCEPCVLCQMSREMDLLGYPKGCI